MSARYCIIGAGPSGLVTAKRFKEHGIAFDWFEKETEPGGAWNFGADSACVYQTTHMISSKRLSAFADFPMPKSFPAYPRHDQVLAYLQAYEDRFGLRPLISFGREVSKLWRSDGKWHVLLDREDSPHSYDGVVVANGHNNIPNWPDCAGHFDGTAIHSRDYKRPKQLSGKRVLVVGGGNSGCDIAVDAANHADKVVHSLRRGYHFLPKFVSGRPVDVMYQRTERLPLPRFVRRYIQKLIVTLVMGSAKNHGLPQPDHGLFDVHPLINSVYPHYLHHERINTKPDIERLEGDCVRFKDGSVEVFDLIIYATGFKATFPFLERDALLHEDGRSKLLLNVFHPDWNGLFVVGLIQPNGGLFPLADCQSKLIAQYVSSIAAGRQYSDSFRETVSGMASRMGSGQTPGRSRRHALEVNFLSYGRLLNRILARTDRRIPSQSFARSFEAQPRTSPAGFRLTGA